MRTNEKEFDTLNLSKEYSERLQDIARDLKKTYADFLDVYGRDKDDYWWISPIVSRNTSWDKTYQNICELLLCIDVLNTRECRRVIVSTNSIKNILSSLYPDKKIICTKSSKRLRFLFDKVGGFLIELNSFIIDSIVKPITWKLYRRKKNYSTGEVLVIQPLLSNMIRSDGNIQERYLGTIDNYTNKIVDFYYQLTNNESISNKTLVKKCNKISNNSVIEQELFSFKDIIIYAKYKRYLKKIARDTYIFNGINISPIIKESLLCSAKMYEVAYSYSIARRFFESNHYKYVLLWYEGRPLDNAIALALNCASIKSKFIGVIQYPLSDFTFCAMNTKGQIERNACPTTISVTGKSFIYQVKQIYNGRETIILPYLRKRMKYIGRTEEQIVKILVALPYLKKECQVILEILDKFIEKTTDQIEIVIKMHPVFEGKDVSIYTEKELNFTPKYVSGNIFDCMKGVSIAISSSSSASMDIICAGIPLICVNILGQIYDTWIPQDISKELYFSVYDIHDFEKAYNKIKYSDEWESDKKIDIQRYFVTPSVEMINDILK